MHTLHNTRRALALASGLGMALALTACGTRAENRRRSGRRGRGGGECADYEDYGT